MKKILLSIMLLAMATMAMAQTEPSLPPIPSNLAPGLYIVDSNLYIPLDFCHVRTSGVGVGSIDITNHKIKGLSATQRATGTFLMVCDPSKRATIQTRRKQRVFVRHTTPESFTLLPLEQKKNKRLVGRDLGAGIIEVDLASFKSLPFEWKQVSADTYLISANLAPGQYALFFRPSPMSPISYMAAWDFYIE